MRRYAPLVAAIICFVPFSAHSQDIQISSFCQQISDFKQSGDVTYRAGIGASGNAVIPADINVISFPVIDPVSVPVEVDLAEHFDFSRVEGLELIPTLADLQVFHDGRVSFNGQDITQTIVNGCEGVNIPQEAAEITASSGGVSGGISSVITNAISGGSERPVGLVKPLAEKPLQKPLSERIEVEELPVKASSGNDDVIQGQYP